MASIRSRDTRPEMEVRRRLHARGMRYRVDVALLDGSRRRTDIAFLSARVAVFIDGCFWHGCPEHFKPPQTNPQYWATKIATNQRRDLNSTEALTDAGWRVLRFWEHEDPERVVANVEAVVRAL